MKWFGSYQESKGGKTLNDSYGGTVEVSNERYPKLSISMGLTINLGEYQFRKVDFSVTVPCVKWENREKVYVSAKIFVEDTLQYLVKKYHGADCVLPQFPEDIELPSVNSGIDIFISRGDTIPLQNYESAKCNISMSWPELQKKHLEEALKDISCWISKKCEDEILEAKS